MGYILPENSSADERGQRLRYAQAVWYAVDQKENERIETLITGAGQAGLPPATA